MDFEYQGKVYTGFPEQTIERWEFTQWCEKFLQKSASNFVTGARIIPKEVLLEDFIMLQQQIILVKRLIEQFPD